MKALIQSPWTLWVSWGACDRLWSFYPFRPTDKTHSRPASTLLCQWNTSAFLIPIFLPHSFLHTRQNFQLSALCSGFLSFSYPTLTYWRLFSFSLWSALGEICTSVLIWLQLKMLSCFHLLFLQSFWLLLGSCSFNFPNESATWKFPTLFFLPLLACFFSLLSYFHVVRLAFACLIVQMKMFLNFHNRDLFEVIIFRKFGFKVFWFREITDRIVGGPSFQYYTRFYHWWNRWVAFNHWF